MLRVAIVGAGHWGPNLINNFSASKRSEVVYVVDQDAARLAAVRDRFPQISVCEGLDEVLEQDEVDAVVIATPTTTHASLAERALYAGKHVLVEKPLTHSVETSRALCALAEEKGVRLMVGHVFVYNPAARQVKGYINAGELGRIHYISMERTNLGPIRVDVDAAWDLAAHDISMANHWLDARPLAVSAVGGAWINPGISDAVFATFRYPDDVLVHLHASWLNPRKARDITIVGDKQMLTFDDMNLSEPLRIYDKQVRDDRSQPDFVHDFTSFRMSVQEGDIKVPRVAMSQPLRNECEHFLDVILEDEPCLSSGQAGLDVVVALEALSQSVAERGREVSIDP